MPAGRGDERPTIYRSVCLEMAAAWRRRAAQLESDPDAPSVLIGAAFGLKKAAEHLEGLANL